MPDPAGYVLELVPLADPQAEWGHPARDADYRLKLALKYLLRAHGLRCVAVRDRRAERQVPAVPAGESHHGEA